MVDAATDLAASKAEKVDQEMRFLAQINALRRQGTEKDEEHKEQISQMTSELTVATQAYETVLIKERSASSEAIKATQRLLDKDREVFVLTTAAEANRCETQALRTQMADMTKQFKTANDDHTAQIKKQSDEYAVLLNKFNEISQANATIDQRGMFAADSCGALALSHSQTILTHLFLYPNLFSVKDLEAQSDALKQQLSNMAAAKVVDDEQTLLLQSSLKQANDEIERLKRLLADMTSAKNVGDARISTLEGQGRDDADKLTLLNKRVTELEAVLQRIGEEMAAKYAAVTAFSAAANEEIIDLKRQLLALSTSSSQSIVDLQAQLKDANDGRTILADKHAELMAVNATANKQVEALTAQGKDDTNELANQLKRIAELEVTLNSSVQAKANVDTQLEATNREMVDLQASSSKIIADWETECKRNAAELAGITKTHADVMAAMVVAERTIAEWETTCKDKDIEIASLTDQQTNIRTSSAAAKNVGDKIIETLKNQLSALSTSSSQSVAVPQTQLKTMKDEASAFSKKYNDLATAKASADKQVESLTVQGKNDADEILSLTMRASELATQVKRYAFHCHVAPWNDCLPIYLPSIPSLHQQYRFATSSIDDISFYSRAYVSCSYFHSITKANALEETKHSNRVVIHLQQENEIAGLEKRVVDLEAARKESNGELMAMSLTHMDLVTFSAGAKDASDKEIVHLQGQLVCTNDELSVLTNKYASLASAKAAADDQIVALIAQGKRDALEFDRTKRQLSSAVSVLDGDIDQLKEQLREITDEFEAANNLAEKRTRSKETEVTTLQRLLANKDAEIDNAVKKLSDIQTLQNEKDLLSMRIETLSCDLHTLRDERASALNEHQRLNDLVASLERQIKTEQADKEARLRKRDAAAQEMVVTLTRIESQLALVRQQLDERTEEKELLVRTHHEKMIEFGQIRSQLVSLQNNRTQMDRNLLDIHHKLIAAEAAEQNASRHAVECEEELARLRAKLEALTIKSEETTEMLRKSQTDCAEKDNNIALRSSSLEALRVSNKVLQVQFDAASDEQAVMTKKYQDSMVQIVQLDREKEFEKNKVTGLVAEVSSLSRRLQAITNEATESESAARKEQAVLQQRIVELLAANEQYVLAAELGSLKHAASLEDHVALSLAKEKAHKDQILQLEMLRLELESLLDASKRQVGTLEGQGRDDADKLTLLNKRVTELEAVLQRIGEEMAAKYAAVTAFSAAANEEIIDLKRQLLALSTSSSQSIVDLQAQLKDANDGRTILADKHAELMAVNATANKQVEALTAQGKDDTNELANQLKRIAELEVTLNSSVQAKANVDTQLEATIREMVDLQAQLKDANDGRTALADKHTELMAVNATANKQVEALTAQCKDDTNEIANQVKRIAELEVTLNKSVQAKANVDTQLEATNREMVDLQASSSKIIADWETECKRNAAELAGITKTHADVMAAMVVAERTIAEWETTCKDKDIEIASLTDQQTNIRTSSAAAKNVGDKIIETLKNQLSALSTSSSQSVADLQEQLKTMKDEASALTKKYDDLAESKALADKQVESLTVQGQNDADEILSLTMRASELVTQVKRYAFHCHVAPWNDCLPIFLPLPPSLPAE